MQMKITPKFNIREIMDDTIKKDWFQFQEKAFFLGEKLRRYMQAYINSHRRRSGGSGNLANSINFDKMSRPGTVGWGIGHIPTLMNRAPYWYVVNYGKTVSGKPYVPNYGGFVPGKFRGGDGRPKSEYAGKGVERFDYQSGAGSGMWPAHAIRPMNYIQATMIKLDKSFKALILTLRRGF